MRTASTILSAKSLSNAVPRQAKLAPFAATVAQRSRGRSKFPARVVGVMPPVGVVALMFAASHAEVEIVKDQHRNADVAARRVEEMCASNPGPAISDHHDHLQLRVSQFDARRVSNAPSMEPMESICYEVLIGQPLAPDVGDQNKSLWRDSQLHQCLVEARVGLRRARNPGKTGRSACCDRWIVASARLGPASAS